MIGHPILDRRLTIHLSSSVFCTFQLFIFKYRSFPLIICYLRWKQLLETERINPVAYTVIERIGARGLGAHLRTFCDFLVYEFANSGKGQHVNKCIDVLNEMVWQYNVVTIERLVLCLAL